MFYIFYVLPHPLGKAISLLRVQQHSCLQVTLYEAPRTVPFPCKTLTTEFSGSISRTSAGAGPGGPRCISLELRSIWATGIWCWAVPATLGGSNPPVPFSRRKVRLNVLFLSSFGKLSFPLFTGSTHPRFIKNENHFL